VGRLHNRSDSANLGGDLPSASTVTTRMHAAAICCEFGRERQADVSVCVAGRGGSTARHTCVGCSHPASTAAPHALHAASCSRSLCCAPRQAPWRAG
jgi:hypothetical protein